MVPLGIHLVVYGLRNARLTDCQYQFIELLRYKGRLVGHSFRHSISMILHEKGCDWAEIETLFAHIDKNAPRGTYNHAQYMEGRWEIVQG